MKKKRKYIVFEDYLFGRNYYNEKLQCVPDYQITENKIPVVNEDIMSILIERNPYLRVEELVEEL